MKPLFDLVIKHVPRRWLRKARSGCSAPFSRPTPISAASSRAAIASGSVKPNQAVKVLSRDGKVVEPAGH